MNNVLMNAAVAAMAADGSGNGTILMIVYLVVIFGFLYFIMIRPQRKEQKQKAALLSNLQVGDSVRTTGGFIGTIIDVADDMVIVEFGNNKNCRIPMQKAAIAQIEKPGQSTADTAKKDEKKSEKKNEK